MAWLRMGLLVVCLLVAAPVAIVAAWICRPGGPVAQALGRVFCRTVLRLLRVRVTVSGVAPPAAGGTLLAANHVSWIDPLVLFAVTPAAVLAKREVGTWPVIAALARLQATVLVDRTRRMQIPKVNRALADRLLAGHNMLLFPEGTTFDGSRRGRFRTSHFGCLTDVLARQPDASPKAQVAALTYSDRGAAWIGDDTLLPHLWAVLCRPGMTCHVVFGAPVPVCRGYDRKALGRRLAAEVETLLGAASFNQALETRPKSEVASGLIMTAG